MNANDNMRYQKTRTIVGIVIMLLIAAIHIFRLGSYLNGKLYIYYYSFASDFIIPFGCYFLLCMKDIQIKILGKWYVKAGIVFGLSTLTEILQSFGIYILGVTFDIIDIIMFGFGVLTAVIIDKQLFKRWIPFWEKRLVPIK